MHASDASVNGCVGDALLNTAVQNVSQMQSQNVPTMLNDVNSTKKLKYAKDKSVELKYLLIYHPNKSDVYAVLAKTNE